MTNPTLHRDLQAGLSRLYSIESQLETSSLTPLQELSRAQRASQQPWLILGCSDGIGFQTTIAAIKAGVLKCGLGVYWEPPHFLELKEDQTPVSPVHYARYQNTLALKAYASAHGATFEVLSADCIMAPKRGLKGEIKEPPNPLDPRIIDAFERVRQSATTKDAILINSVAFGKWICPREGFDPIEVPSINFDGEIVLTKTKPFHRRGYEETLDTMGRNHKLLLETARKHGWLGPHSTTAFYTWAGGSQNIDVLEGIYGKGSLGDAKAVAEGDTAAFRLTHGLSLGAHAIVRLPAFLSAALMGIPGGGLFGLISRHYLQQKEAFFDMPTLASRTVRRLLGEEWIRENPISQIELDMQETLHIEGIKASVAAANQAVYVYLKTSNHDPHQPIDLKTSQKLLAHLVPHDYVELLARFRPEIDGLTPPKPAEKAAETKVKPKSIQKSTNTFRSSNPTGEYEAVKVPLPTPRTYNNSQPHTQHDHTTHLGNYNDIRPDIPLFETLRHLKDHKNSEPQINLEDYTVIGEDLVVQGYLSDTQLNTSYDIQKIGDKFMVYRSIVNPRGQQVAKGTLILGPKTLLKVDDDLGDPMGHAMPVRTPLDATYGPNFHSKEFQRAALLKFVADQIRAAGGLLDDSGRLRLSARFGKPVQVGQTLQTYAKRNEQSLIVTILRDNQDPVLRVELRQ